MSCGQSVQYPQPVTEYINDVWATLSDTFVQYKSNNQEKVLSVLERT